MKKSASALGAAILGLGSSFFATPAMAAELADCGTAPAGGTLTLTGDVCLLTFSTPGSYNFTTPKAFSGLAVLLVGAGGGADYSTGQNQDAGYAGSGGKVTYVDLSSNNGEESLSITVGAGGASSNTTIASGQASTLTVGSSVSTAAGGAMGIAANAPTYCAFSGNGRDYLGVGDGAGGNSPSRAGETCVEAPGVNPSLGTADSSGTPASSLFAGLNQEFGAGGKLFALPASLPTQTVGAGANAVVDPTSDGLDPVADAAGANGFAAIAWQLPATPDAVALADTGSDAYAPLLLGAGAMALGAVLFSRAGRRRVR